MCDADGIQRRGQTTSSRRSTTAVATSSFRGWRTAGSSQPVERPFLLRIRLLRSRLSPLCRRSQPSPSGVQASSAINTTQSPSQHISDLGATWGMNAPPNLTSTTPPLSQAQPVTQPPPFSQDARQQGIMKVKAADCWVHSSQIPPTWQTAANRTFPQQNQAPALATNFHTEPLPSDYDLLDYWAGKNLLGL